VATILEKRQRLSAISDRQKALKSNYEKNKAFSQEERDETKALSAEVETLKTEIAALEAQEAEDRKFLAAADALATDLAKPLPRATQPDSLGGATFDGTAADVKLKAAGRFKPALASSFRPSPMPECTATTRPSVTIAWYGKTSRRPARRKPQCPATAAI
jgi:hypothetical protein